MVTGRFRKQRQQPLLVSLQTTGERGGAEYANVDLLAALQRRGHAVLLATNLGQLAAGTDLPVEVVSLGPKLNRRSVIPLLLAAPWLLYRCARLLARLQPDVLLLHFKKEQLLCALLPRRLTGRIVWAEWGPVPRQLRRGLPRLLFAAASRRAEAVVAVSPGTARSLLEAGVEAERVTVVPNLVDPARIRRDPAARDRIRAGWGVGERTCVIGCISRFQRKKRNDVLIDAMALLQGEDAILVLAGEGEELPALQRRAAPLGDRVRFHPNVRGHAVEFLSACDLLAFAPSPTEGEPRVIVMAQLVGLPVVATAPEGAVDLVVDGAGVIAEPPNDPHAVAVALGAYVNDPKRRTVEGEQARRLREQSHDPERNLRALERALGMVLDEERP
jgi:glycosyltransferase involved in cell wall biosynthesis